MRLRSRAWTVGRLDERWILYAECAMVTRRPPIPGLLHAGPRKSEHEFCEGCEMSTALFDLAGKKAIVAAVLATWDVRWCAAS